jgi:hypothetical protein
MSKLITNPITQSDIREYLINYSDFSFELRVLKKFVDLGLECSHGGTYEDPVTSKSRQFDIRALLQEDYVRIHLSIECKNIRDNFPLIVHCLKRKANESYNELIDTHKPEDQNEVQRVSSISISLPPIFREFSRSIRVSQLSLYHKGYYVAKSTDQIGRRQNDSEITSFDGEVFDKISQAINSAVDLISEAHYLDTSKSPFYLTFVCPVLIVPDMSLWQVKYTDDGAQIEEPEQIEHISYYIGKDWTVGDKIHSLNYTLSHLEIVTYSGIKNFVEKYLYVLMKRCFAVVSRGAEFS